MKPPMMSRNGKNKTKLSIARLSFVLVFRGLPVSLPSPLVATD